MQDYFRPILCSDAAQAKGALRLAGGWTWFAHAEHLRRGHASRVIPASDLPQDIAQALTNPRPDVAGLSLETPRLMGILNVTPDSFSDGGDFATRDRAVEQGRALAGQGADILDIGGESTRPGAAEVAVAEEIERTVPVIRELAVQIRVPISIDTRKATVARAAVEAGAGIINDVAAFRHDPSLGEYASQSGLPVCLMHMQGTPETMAIDPRYDDVLLDVYDQLAERRDAALAAGVAQDRILLDPGIGFGKNTEHNLTLLRGLALLHGLGCPLVLGVSRKRFIGDVAQVPQAKQRLPGSIAVALAGVAQGVQILRVHDIEETRQAITLHNAVTGTGA